MRRSRLRKRILKVGVNVLCMELRFVEKVFGLLLLGFEAFLLASEHIVGDEALVRELDKIELVAFERTDRAAVTLDIAAYDLRALGGVAAHIGPYGFSNLLGQPDGAVVLFDGLLHERHGIVAAATAATDTA